MSVLERNGERLQAKVRELLMAGLAPLVFMDLDDTLNRSFGALIEPAAVEALRQLAGADGLFGVNTGADIVWAGERILSETDRLFAFPFLVLGTGMQIYAWVESLQAYARLPILGEDKGRGLRYLAEYLDVPLDRVIYIADFPGAGDLQEGIDDSVLREPLGAVVNVGAHRPPDALRSVSPQTLLLHPEHGETSWGGTGYGATVHYVEAIAEILRDKRFVEVVRAQRAELMSTVERRWGVVPAAGASVQLWTFERRTLVRDSGSPVRVVVQREGLVHAGVRRGEDWARTYELPLREVAPGEWEALLLDPEINELTFIWYDPTRSGKVRWEGMNFRLRDAAAG
jgi:hypothetical protein